MAEARRACLRLGVAGLAVLAGCVSPPAQVDCRDPALQRFLGQPLDDALRALDLPEGSYKVDYPSPIGVTLEEFPDRLRISVDDGFVIRSIGCG